MSDEQEMIPVALRRENEGLTRGYVCTCSIDEDRCPGGMGVFLSLFLSPMCYTAFFTHVHGLSRLEP